MLRQGVELSCSNITSPPKCRMCLPRIMVNTSEGMKVFSIKTAFVPVFNWLGDAVPWNWTVGNTSAWENCNPKVAGKPLPKVCGTNQFPCRTNEYRNSFTREELKVWTSETCALQLSAALLSQPIGQAKPSGSALVLWGLSCIL